MVTNTVSNEMTQLTKALNDATYEYTAAWQEYSKGKKRWETAQNSLDKAQSHVLNKVTSIKSNAEGEE